MVRKESKVVFPAIEGMEGYVSEVSIRILLQI
jgi:hypothetical protein